MNFITVTKLDNDQIMVTVREAPADFDNRLSEMSIILQEKGDAEELQVKYPNFDTYNIIAGQTLFFIKEGRNGAWKHAIDHDSHVWVHKDTLETDYIVRIIGS